MYLCQLALCIANMDWRKPIADSSTIFFLFVRRTDAAQGGMLLISSGMQHRLYFLGTLSGIDE